MTLTLAAASIITCLSLSAVDGDTIKCNGQNMRLLGPGSPNVSGVNAPEIGKAKCKKEELLGRQAKRRLQEILSLNVCIEDSGVKNRYGRPLVGAPAQRQDGGRVANQGRLRRCVEARQEDRLVQVRG